MAMAHALGTQGVGVLAILPLLVVQQGCISRSRCDGPASVTEAEARTKAEAFLSDPALVPALRPGQPAPTIDDQSYSFTVERAEAAPDELGAASGTVSLRKRDGAVVYFSVKESRAWFPDEVMLFAQAREVAEAFLKRQYPALWSDGTVQVREDPRIDSRRGTYYIHFVKVVEGFVTLHRADVHIRAYDGRVEKYVRVEEPYEIPPEIITQEAAKNIARKAAASVTGLGLERPDGGSAVLSFWSPPDGSESRPIWAVTLQYAAKAADPGRGLAVDVYINAISGEVEDIAGRRVAERSPEGPGGAEKSRAPVNDSWPVWRADGAAILFLSNRPRQGHPSWRSGNKTLFLADLPTRGTACVLQGLDETEYRYPTWGTQPWAVCESLQVVAVSMDTGRVEVLMPEDRNGQMPHLSADGRLLAFSAHRRHGDVDVFTAQVTEADGKVDLEREIRCARTPGADVMPILSADGQWVYYAHETLASRESPPQVELRRTKTGVRDWDNEPPETILTGLGRVRRMSWFPDGNRLLVWHDAGLDVVDVVGKTQTPLDLPDLQDPDMAEAPPLEVREPVLSPDGQRLAFSGLLRSGDDRSGWYIYTCRLDGADLQRVTPLDNAPVASYRFPDSGRTSFEIAKEDILARLQSEDK